MPFTDWQTIVFLTIETLPCWNCQKVDGPPISRTVFLSCMDSTLVYAAAAFPMQFVTKPALNTGWGSLQVSRCCVSSVITPIRWSSFLNLGFLSVN